MSIKKRHFACNQFSEKAEGNQCLFDGVSSFIRFCLGRQKPRKITGFKGPNIPYLSSHCKNCLTKDNLHRLKDIPDWMKQ